MKSNYCQFFWRGSLQEFRTAHVIRWTGVPKKVCGAVEEVLAALPRKHRENGEPSGAKAQCKLQAYQGSGPELL
jgi:hypothetical protein